MPTDPTQKESLDLFADNMRIALKDIAAQVNDMKSKLMSGDEKFDGEVFANLTLCL